jgi:hypothetical protein
MYCYSLHRSMDLSVICLDKTFIIITGSNMPFPADIVNLGFKVSENFTLLGAKILKNINNFHGNFTTVADKINKQINFWKIFGLSLADRIRICKCLLVSQLTYLGSFFPPEEEMLKRIQGLPA